MSKESRLLTRITTIPLFLFVTFAAGAVVGCALLKSLSGFNAHQEDVDVTFAYAQSAM